MEDLPIEILREVVALLPRADLSLRAPLVARRWREVLQDRRVWAHLPPLLRLPDNLLLQVLGYLWPRELFAVAMASTELRRLATRPVIWRSFDINDIKPDTTIYLDVNKHTHTLEEQRQAGGWPDARDILQRVCLRIDTDDTQDLLHLCRSLARHSHGVRGATFSGPSLAAVPAPLLAAALSRCGILTFHYTAVTQEQMTALMATLAVVEPAPRRFAIYERRPPMDHEAPPADTSLASLSPQQLLPALSQVTELFFLNTNLPPIILVALFEAISSGCSIKKIEFSGVDLSSVPPDLLEAAVKKLDQANLVWCRLGEEAVVRLVKMWVRGEQGQLTSLQLRGNQVKEALRRRGERRLLALARTDFAHLLFL